MSRYMYVDAAGGCFGASQLRVVMAFEWGHARACEASLSFGAAIDATSRE